MCHKLRLGILPLSLEGTRFLVDTPANMPFGISQGAVGQIPAETFRGNDHLPPVCIQLEEPYLSRKHTRNFRLRDGLHLRATLGIQIPLRHGQTQILSRKHSPAGTRPVVQWGRSIPRGDPRIAMSSMVPINSLTDLRLKHWQRWSDSFRTSRQISL